MRLNQLIYKKMTQWFNQRMPVGDQLRLNLHSIYILPTRAGLLLVVIIILMMIGATNYQNNLVYLLTFLLVGIALVCTVYTARNLQGIIVQLNSLPEAYANKVILLDVKLSSEISDGNCSIAIGKNKQSLLLSNVPSKGVNLSVKLGKYKRGEHQLPRLILTSQFPLGWLRAWSYIRFEKKLLVYPEPIQPPSTVNQNINSVNDEDKGQSVIGVEDLDAIRAYQQGDLLSRINWKAYAKGRGLLVNDYTSYVSDQTVFSWEDFLGHDKERVLSYLTYQVIDASQKNLAYSLVLPNKVIPISSGERHQLNCLKTLALYDGMF